MHATGRNAEKSSELATEMPLVTVPDLDRDLSQGITLKQQVFRQRDAALNQVRVRGDAQRLLECADEVIRAHFGCRRNCVERRVFDKVRINVVACTSDCPG